MCDASTRPAVTIASGWPLVAATSVEYTVSAQEAPHRLVSCRAGTEGPYAAIVVRCGGPTEGVPFS